MTPRTDPSPLPPGVLLQREPPVAARRRRPAVAQRTLFVTAAPPPPPAVAPEQLPFDFAPDEGAPLPDERDGAFDDPGPSDLPRPSALPHASALPRASALPGLSEDGSPPEQLPFEFIAAAPTVVVPPVVEDAPPAATVEPGPPDLPSGEVAEEDAAPAATPTEAPGDEAPEPEADAERRRPWRTVAQFGAWTTAVVAVAVVLLIFVFPTRTYLAQRHQLAAAAGELRLLDNQNSQLAAQVARLRTDQEIERIAREQYHLVRPGESAIAILPPPTPPAAATPLPPPPKPHPNWLHRLTSWIP